MLPSELLVRFRSELRDEVEPYLWSDDDFYFYLTNAQNDFVRLTGGINDTRSTLTRITLADGVQDYLISPKILKIRAVYRPDGDILVRENDENILDGYNGYTEPAGKVHTAIIAADQDYLRVVPTPDATEDGVVLQMAISRLPSTGLLQGDTDLEIQEHHHPYLLLSVYSQAHMKQDAETFNNSQSQSYETRFREYCDRSRRDKDRREYTPHTIVYGGL